MNNESRYENGDNDLIREQHIIYIVKETFIIYDSRIDKHMCVCATAEIAEQLAALMNKYEDELNIERR